MPIIILLIFLLCGSTVSAKELYIEDFSSYADNAALNQAWMGYAPDRASLLDENGKKIGRFQLELDTANPWNAYFNLIFSKPLDLSEFTKFEIKLRTDSPGSISAIPLYFLTSATEGYCMPYTAARTGWKTESIPKTFYPWTGCRADSEGWKRIIGMRFVVKPSETKNINLDIASIKFRDDTLRLEEMGSFANFSTYGEVLSTIEKALPNHANRSEIQSRLNDVKVIHQQLSKKEELSSIRDQNKIKLGKKLLIESWALSQKVDPVEKTRGLFSHFGDGLQMNDGSMLPWAEAIPEMKENGFNRIFPNVLWSGLAYYPSSVVSSHSLVQNGVDHMKELIQLGKENDVEIHAWKVMFRFAEGWLAPADVVTPFREQNRMQITDKGEQFNTLTLCDSRNIDYEIQAIEELVTKYPVHGLMLDYIRYQEVAELPVDYHEKCRPLFETFSGKKVANWPHDVFPTGILAQEYAAWKRSMITNVVALIHARVKAIRPDLILSASVFDDPMNAYTEVSQDWGDWAKKGIIDLLIPMNYTESGSKFNSILLAGKRAVQGSNVPLHTTLTTHNQDWSGPAPLEQIVEQILINREQRETGYVLFSSVEHFRVHNMPYIARGLHGMTDVVLPVTPDSDNDGLNDDREIIYETDPHSVDTDGDGISDSEEVANGTDPIDPTSPLLYSTWNAETVYKKGDTVLYNNALWSAKFWTQNSTPEKTEWKAWNYLSELNDLDNDGLSNREEVHLKTDWNNPDSDGDSVLDGVEVREKTDPLDASDFPVLINNWSAEKRYEKGDSVLYQEKLWIARWISIGEEPGSSDWVAWEVIK